MSEQQVLEATTKAAEAVKVAEPAKKAVKKPAKVAEPEKTPQNRKAPTPRQARPQLSRPAFHRTLEINSLQVQKVVERSFSRTSNALFSIDVILQIIGDREDVSRAEEAISIIFEKVSDDLLLEIEQAKIVMSSAGISEMPEYTNPKKYPIEITSPQIAEFARLLTVVDELMMLVDTLWLNGASTNRKHSDKSFEWQQRLMRLAGRIIGIEKHARIAAYKKGQQEEIDSAAPEIAIEDEELASVSKEEELALASEEESKKKE